MTSNNDLNLILVDDDEDDREFLAHAAQKTGNVQLTCLEGGEQLFHYLQTNPIVPDGILLDINMPIISGIDCLETIRHNDQWKTIPVIMYSTSDSDNDIKTTYSMGANLFIKKPSVIAKLRAVIEYLLDNSSWKSLPNSLNDFLIKF